MIQKIKEFFYIIKNYSYYKKIKKLNIQDHIY